MGKFSAYSNQQLIQQGIALLQQNKASSRQVFLELLKREPKHPDGNHLLGCALLQQGQVKDACKALRMAATLQPSNPQILSNAGVAHSELGDHIQALKYFEQVLRLAPQNADAQFKAAISAAKAGQIDKAINLIDQLLRQRPRDAQLISIKAMILQDNQRLEQAAEVLKSGLEAVPNHAEWISQLASCSAQSGNHVDAIPLFEQALNISPNHTDSLYGLGMSLISKGELERARKLLEQATKQVPDNIKFLLGLANIQQKLRQFTPALKRVNQVLSKQPDNHSAHELRVAIGNYAPDTSTQQSLEFHRSAGKAIGRIAQTKNIANTRYRPKAYQPGSRVKIGYVSRDFCRHSVAYFFLPLIRHHNKEDVHVTCFFTGIKEDEITEKIKAHADEWHNISQVDHGSLLESVRSQELDILVDLTGYTDGHRLELFAQRAAPVQVTWLGYPNTTGLPNMDYRIVDAVTDPLPDAQKHATETLLQLPDGFLCFDSIEERPCPAKVPALSNGFITFGSFNNLIKISDDVLKVWATILLQVPQSKLLIKSVFFADQAVRASVLAKFLAEGIEPERLILIERTATTEDHLKAYDQVDIALDSFPYNGTTTTFEALWMGVPVIAYKGDRHASRVSASILEHSSLSENLLANDVEEYVNKAVELAGNIATLEALRGSLRTSLQASALCDAKGFAAKFEKALLSTLA